MSDITYEFEERGILNVRLGRKIVGVIRKCQGGYQYKPTGGKGGDIMPTVEDVKRSIEGRDPAPIPLNASVVVIRKEDEPLRMTQDFGTITAPDGEKITVVTGFPAPGIIVLRGEKLTGTIDLMPLIQEAVLHVIKANAS